MRSSSARVGVRAAALFILLAGLAIPAAAHAACGAVTTASWTASGDGAWTSGSSWSTGVVPDACTDVTLSPSALPAEIFGIPDGAAVHALTVAPGVRLSGTSLTAGSLTWTTSSVSFENHLAVDLTVTGAASLQGNGTTFVDRTGGHGSLTLQGQSQMSAAMLQLNGGASLVAQGALTISSPSTIEGATTGTVSVPAGGAIAAADGGEVRIHAATVQVAGTLAASSAGLILDADTTTLADGATVSGAGVVGLEGDAGATSVPAAVHVNAPATLRLDAGTVSGAGTISGTGTFAWRGGHLDGAPELAAAVDVAGTADKFLDGASTLTLSGPSSWTGSAIHGTSADLVNHGVLTGDLTFDVVSLDNGGTVAPAGVLTVDGDYVQHEGALLDADVAEGGSDRLAVTGIATLAGGVRARTADGYLPPLGATFPILQYASRSGALSGIRGDIIGDDRHYALQTGATVTSLVVVAGGGPSVSVGDATTAEHGSVTVPVTLSAASGSPVSVHVATADGSATAGADYTATAADLTFAAGETTKSVSIPIADDGADEPDETFSIRLSDPTGAWIKHTAATITIADDDGPAPPITGPIVTAPNGGGSIAKPPTTTVAFLADDVCASPQVLSIGSARVRGCFTGSGAVKTAQGKIDVDGVQLAPSSGAKITVDTSTGEVRPTNGGSVDASTYDPFSGARVVLGRMAVLAGGAVLRVKDHVRGYVAATSAAAFRGLHVVGSIALRAARHAGEMLLDAEAKLPSLLGGLTARMQLVTDAALRRIQATASTVKANLAKLVNFGLDDLDLHLTQAGFTGSAKFRFANIPFAASIAIDPSGTVRDAHVTGSGNGPGRFRVNALDLHAYELDAGQELIGTIDVADTTPDGRRGLSARGAVAIRWPQGGSWTAMVPSATVALGSDTLVGASFTLGPTSMSFGGTWTLDDASLHLHAKAAVSGWTTFGLPFAYEAFGAGDVAIPGLSARGDAVVSSAGLGACAGVDVGIGSVKRTIRVGFTWPSAGTPALWFAGCDLGPVRVAKTARVAQAAGASFAVSGRPDAVLLAVHGTGGAPAPVLDGPGGRHVTPVAAGASVPAGGAMAFPDPGTSTTYVLLAAPAAGRWTVAAADGSPAIARVETAEALAQPGVTARVGGAGARRTLRWTAKLAPGDRVRFIEEAGGLHHVLGTTTAASGRLAFAPAEGPAGTRRITALVERAGVPRATLEAGRYRASLAPLPAPRRLAVRRGARALSMSWAKVAGADHYEAVVRVGGRQPATVLTRGRSLDLPAVAPSARGTVRVRAVTALERAGRPRTATLRPARAQKRRRR